jgi:uncharacterized protein (DUF58 family)
VNAPIHLVPSTLATLARPSKKFAFAFGRRFFLLLLIGLVWIGPAWNDRRYLFAMAAWDATVFLLCIWDFVRLPKPGELEVRREWSAPPQLTVEAIVNVQVRNLGKVAIRAELIDEMPASFRDSLPTLELTVGAGDSASLAYAIVPRERGDVRVGNVFLRYQSPLQIAERWAMAVLQQTVRVYPNLKESKRDTIYLIRSRQIALERRHKHQAGQGREFESLREYREGDEFRDICWTATARRGKIISKAYQAERSQTVWLILDTGRLLRTRVAGMSKLDYSVAAALALAQVALYSGDRVGVIAYGRQIRQRIAAGRGSSHLRAMLEAFAQIHTEQNEADHLRAAESLLIYEKRRSLIVWLTDLTETATTPEVIESAMQLARRHLVLFAAIAQPDLRELLVQRPKTDVDTFRYAAAQEIVQRRDVLLRTLRQQGALTMEIEPSRLSSAVVNQYLAAKERGMI